MAGGKSWNPQETRWWVSKTQTGANYSVPLSIDPAFAGAVDGIVKSGTPYPANDATIKGFIINDVELDSSQIGASLLIKGIINRTYLPVTLSDDAVAALTTQRDISILDTTGPGFVPAPVAP
jgi:hypothetical protein